MLLVTALAICFLLSWGAGALGLAPIVGAFAAGLVLEEVHYRDRFGDRRLEDEVRSISTVLVPLFFVRTGIDVDLRAFGHGGVLLLAGSLVLAAAGGKQLCGLGALERNVDRVAIGLGMIPRGEVALIAASAGRVAGVTDDSTYSSIVVAVIASVLATPPLLKWRLSRSAA
jgi:Kef-type K+ transport system membrane component KefB